MTPKANDNTGTTSTTMEQESSRTSPDCDFVTSSISEEEETQSQFSEASYEDDDDEEEGVEEEGTDWDSLGPASPSQRRQMSPRKGHFLEDSLEEGEEEEDDDSSSRPLENIYGIPRLGDPLPVISEKGSGAGSSTSPSSRRNHSTPDPPTNYDDEADEFHLDMNTTKVAFASYRNAVLHLVHHQDRSKSSSSDPKSLRDNERMSNLEEHAKWYVEQKAQTFHEAVPVAMEWREWSMERKAGIHNLSMALKERTEVGVELIQRLKEEKEKKVKRRVGKKMEEDRRERNTTRTNGGASKESKSKSSSLTSSSSSKPKAKPKPKAKNPTPPPVVSKPKPKRTTQETIGVPRRKAPPRHPSCIKHTLPKFQAQQAKPHKKVKKKEDPMTYRTTEWIGDLIQWKMARRKHLEQTLRTCGCPDCLGELKVLERMGFKLEVCSR